MATTRSSPSLAPVRQTVKHSWVGISSFVVGLLALSAIMVPLVSLARIVLFHQINGITYDDVIDWPSLLAVASPGLACFGLGLGISGIAQTHSKRIFGTIGIILNSLSVLGFVLISYWSAI